MAPLGSGAVFLSQFGGRCVIDSNRVGERGKSAVLLVSYEHVNIEKEVVRRNYR